MIDRGDMCVGNEHPADVVASPVVRPVATGGGGVGQRRYGEGRHVSQYHELQRRMKATAYNLAYGQGDVDRFLANGLAEAERMDAEEKDIVRRIRTAVAALLKPREEDEEEKSALPDGAKKKQQRKRRKKVRQTSRRVGVYFSVKKGSPIYSRAMARDEVSAVTENAICLHRLAVCDVNFQNVTYSQLGPFRYGHKGADVKPIFGPLFQVMLQRSRYLVEIQKLYPEMKDELLKFVQYWDGP